MTGDERDMTTRLIQLCDDRAAIAKALLDDAARERYEHAAAALREILDEDELPARRMP